MTITIREDFTCGKALSGYSEDRLVRGAHLFGILDGSRGPDVAGSDLISDILDQAVAYLQDAVREITLEAIIADLTAMVSAKKTAAGIEDFRLSGGFVFCLYSDHFGEIWRVGDCKFRQNGKTNAPFWRTEEICAEARAIILQSRLNAGMSVAEIMSDPGYDEVIASLLRHEASFLNRDNDPRSFGAVIGTQIPDQFLERYTALPGSLVITSDGFPVVRDTLAETEEAHQVLLQKDPLCIGDNLQCKGLGPGRTSFDDRSFLAADLLP